MLTNCRPRLQAIALYSSASLLFFCMLTRSDAPATIIRLQAHVGLCLHSTMSNVCVFINFRQKSLWPQCAPLSRPQTPISSRACRWAVWAIGVNHYRWRLTRQVTIVWSLSYIRLMVSHSLLESNMESTVKWLILGICLDVLSLILGEFLNK